MGSIDTTLPTYIPESNQIPTNAATRSLFSLSGKTIIITGGGRGLGITLAAAVLEAGGCAVCIDVLPAPAATEWNNLQILAKKSNLQVTYRRCDITAESELSDCFDQIAADSTEAGAPLGGTIACAGIQQKEPAIEYPVDGFRRIMDVNVTGTFLTIKHSARIFKAEGTKGSIVMIASMSGQVANRVSILPLRWIKSTDRSSMKGLTCTAYNTSKAAVQQMCRSVAQEWGQYGIRVNTLSPGVSLSQVIIADWVLIKPVVYSNSHDRRTPHGGTGS